VASFSVQIDLSAEALRAPAECVITVRGEPLVDLYPFLVEVKVDASRREAAVATLTFETRRDERGQWAVQDQGILAPWEPITIEAAFGSRVEEIMRGYIREVRATYPDNAADARVIVECQDESIALDRGHVRKTWGSDAPTTDAAILQEIVSGKHDLDPENGPGMSGLVLHQDSTDVRFLRARAEANGYELLFQRGSVYFGPMRLDAEPLPPILVYAGPDTSCVQMSVKTDGHLPTKVAFDMAKSADASSERVVVGPNLSLLGTEPADANGAGLDEFTWLLSREGSADEAQLNARAQRKANEFAMRIQAEGDVDGSIYGHVLTVGTPVPVDGLGAWLGGVYYVDSVTHIFTMDGYKQSVKLLRNGYGDNIDGGAASVLGGIL
jgi:phage protein D